jgi:UDP-4-amino-4,6-dideoxy-N-acetyl-beta-L-altrosamine N-acetyltransferase
VITLRPLRDDDKQRLLAWRNSPDVARYMYTPRPIAAEEHEAWWAGLARDSRRRYWIVGDDEGPVGLANLYDITLDHRRCAWAIYIAEARGRGRGIGSCVEYLIMSHVFDDLSLHKLCCEVLATNLRALGLYNRAGFALEGIFREHIAKENRWLDVFALAMICDAWPAAKERMRARLAARGLEGAILAA